MQPTERHREVHDELDDLGVDHLIRELAADGTTVFVSSHLLAEVAPWKS